MAIIAFIRHQQKQQRVAPPPPTPDTPDTPPPSLFIPPKTDTKKIPDSATWQINDKKITINAGANSPAQEILFDELTEDIVESMPKKLQDELRQNSTYKEKVLKTDTLTIEEQSFTIDKNARYTFDRHYQLEIALSQGTTIETSLQNAGEILLKYAKRTRQDALAQMIEQKTEEFKKHTITVAIDGQELTLSPTNTFKTTETALEIATSPTNPEIIATIKYDELSKELLTLVEVAESREFIFSIPPLKERFDTIVRQKEEVRLTADKTIILHNELSLHSNNMAILLYNPDNDSLETLPYAYITEPFKEYWSRINRDAYMGIMKWEVTRQSFCKCKACILKPYPEKFELDKIILERERTQPGYEVKYTAAMVPAPTLPKYNPPVQGWKCGCNRLFYQHQYCKSCKLFPCHKCKKLNFIERECCSCDIEKNSWFCLMCKNTSDYNKPYCTTQLDTATETYTECRNICWAKATAKHSLLWDCINCEHTNLIASTNVPCKKCNAPNNIKRLGQIINDTAFARLKAQYKLLQQKNGGYSLDNLVYQSYAKKIIPANSSATDIITAPEGTYISIDPNDYQDCIGDGLCGYRSVTGEFQSRPQPNSEELQSIFWPCGRKNWMMYPTTAHVVIPRDIITLTPAGFNEEGILYRAHLAGSNVYKSPKEGSKIHDLPEAINSHPILIIKASSPDIHFARLLPIYPEDPTYHYEKFIISKPDASGKRTVTAKRQERKR